MKKRLLSWLLVVAMAMSTLLGTGIAGRVPAALAGGIPAVLAGDESGTATGEGTGSGTGTGETTETGGGTGTGETTETGGDTGTESAEEFTWSSYESWQGIADSLGIWMTTPDSSLIETAGEITQPKTAILNRINKEFQADAVITMAFDISGNGSNNVTGDIFTNHSGIYSKLTCQEEDLVVAGSALNAVRVSNRVGNQTVDTRVGSNIEITIPANTLQADTTYYLSLNEGFGGKSTLTTPIIFQFKTLPEGAVASADTSALAKAIKKAEEVDRSLYTKESLEALDDTLATAKDLIGREGVTQDTVDQTVQFLDADINNLEPNTKGKLGQALADAEKINLAFYTEESQVPYREAIEAGKTAYETADKEDAFYQQALDAITAAKAGLVAAQYALNEYPLTPYSDWQGSSIPGCGLGIYLVEPDAAGGYSVNTTGKINYESQYLWYNTISEDMKGVITFKLYITGNGCKNTPENGSTTFAYMHLYKDMGFTQEVTDQEGNQALVLDSIAAVPSGTNYPGYEADTRPGKIITVHVDEEKLEKGQNYYLYLGGEINTNDPSRCLVDPIVFNFHTESVVFDASYVKTCKLAQTSYTYDGNSKKPGVTVVDTLGENLVENQDYTVTYASGRKLPGTYKVTVTGIGNYSFEKTLSFTIKALTNTITAKSFTKTYSASSQTFSLGASNTGKTKMTYTSSNSKVKVSSTGTVTVAARFIGKATITIKSAETSVYKAASKTVTVTVNPSKTTLVKLTNLATRKLKVEWKKNTVGTGYQIKYAINSKFTSGVKTVNVTKNTTTYKTLTQLTKGKTYYVKIRTYKTVGSSAFYSDWSTAIKMKIVR